MRTRAQARREAAALAARQEAAPRAPREEVAAQPPREEVAAQPPREEVAALAQRQEAGQRGAVRAERQPNAVNAIAQEQPLVHPELENAHRAAFFKDCILAAICKIEGQQPVDATVQSDVLLGRHFSNMIDRISNTLGEDRVKENAKKENAHDAVVLPIRREKTVYEQILENKTRQEDHGLTVSSAFLLRKTTSRTSQDVIISSATDKTLLTVEIGSFRECLKNSYELKDHKDATLAISYYLLNSLDNSVREIKMMAKVENVEVPVFLPFLMPSQLFDLNIVMIDQHTFQCSIDLLYQDAAVSFKFKDAVLSVNQLDNESLSVLQRALLHENLYSDSLKYKKRVRFELGIIDEKVAKMSISATYRGSTSKEDVELVQEGKIVFKKAI